MYPPCWQVFSPWPVSVLTYSLAGLQPAFPFDPTDLHLVAAPALPHSDSIDVATGDISICFFPLVPSKGLSRDPFFWLSCAQEEGL